MRGHCCFAGCDLTTCRKCGESKCVRALHVCLSPAELRRFEVEYDRAQRAKEDGPWWHQAAGRAKPAEGHLSEQAGADQVAPDQQVSD